VCRGDLSKIRPSRSVVVLCSPLILHEAVLNFPYPLNPAYLPPLMFSWIQHRLERLREPAKLRAKYTHFRILVIGRANAGKTTLLKRVCNTTEDPCIYDEENHNLVSYLLRGLLCFYRPSTTSSNRLHRYRSLPSSFLSGQSLIPTLYRGIHDIGRPFSFKSNPRFIFHDSPGFEAGGEKELQDVQSFLEEKAKAKEVHDQLHAIWSVSSPSLVRLT